MSCISRPMWKAGWPWGGYVMHALGRPDAPASNDPLKVWKKLPEWEDTAPLPPPSSHPVSESEARLRLAALLGQHAEQLSEIRLGIEAVEARRGDQRHQVASGVGMVIAANEQPCLAANRDAAKLALGGIVVEPQATVVVESCQGGALAMGVAECGAERPALLPNTLVLGIGPGEEGVGVGSQVQLSERLDLVVGILQCLLLLDQQIADKGWDRFMLQR